MTVKGGQSHCTLHFKINDKSKENFDNWYSKLRNIDICTVGTLRPRPGGHYTVSLRLGHLLGT